MRLLSPIVLLICRLFEHTGRTRPKYYMSSGTQGTGVNSYGIRDKMAIFGECEKNYDLANWPDLVEDNAIRICE